MQPTYRGNGTPERTGSPSCPYSVDRDVAVAFTQAGHGAMDPIP